MLSIQVKEACNISKHASYAGVILIPVMDLCGFYWDGLSTIWNTLQINSFLPSEYFTES